MKYVQRTHALPPPVRVLRFSKRDSEDRFGSESMFVAHLLNLQINEERYTFSSPTDPGPITGWRWGLLISWKTTCPFDE
jgi:hypothetical protein